MKVTGLSDFCVDFDLSDLPIFSVLSLILAPIIRAFNSGLPLCF